VPRKIQFRRWWLVAIAGLLIGVIWTLLLSGSNEPIYKGRKLGSWLRGHPREYWPAVLAVGTNALPYLLDELQGTDSGLSQWSKNVLGKISVGPLWRTAADRRYHAGLALQILDTNAVPVLLRQVFATPMRIREDDPSFAAASALKWMGSQVAQDQIILRISQALHSPDSAERRNGCLTVSCWPHTNFANALAPLTTDTNATVRVAAVRAITVSRWNTNLFLPALLVCLNDEEAAVRRFAAEALGYQHTNVVTALPALLAAHAAESARPNRRSDLDLGYFPPTAYSTQSVSWAIESAIKAIDPKATIPRPR
jgi:hypothetical protein